jgi:hypothetical protein
MKNACLSVAWLVALVVVVRADMAPPFVDTPVGQTATGTAVIRLLTESNDAKQYVVVASGDCGEWHAFPATLDKDVSVDGRMHYPVLLTAKVVAHETAASRKALVITRIEPLTPNEVERKVK